MLCTLKNNVYWWGQFIFFNNGWRRLWWLKDRFKDCCAQKRGRFCGTSLLVRVGSPMIVPLTCTPSLKENWPDSTVSRWDQWGIFYPYTGAVDQDCVLMDGKALPCKACFVNEYTERERNRMYGLAWPSPHVNPTEHVWEILQKHTHSRLAQPQMRYNLANALI